VVSEWVISRWQDQNVGLLWQRLLGWPASEYGFYVGYAPSAETGVICSVAVDLRISNVVDVPNYVVSALLPEGIFPG